MILLFFVGTLPAGAEGSDALRWVTPDYPCAYYLNEDGEPAGFLYEIAREALVNRLGIDLRVEFMPWVRCQSLVESGQADMMLTTPTPGRLQYTVTTESPVWTKKRLLLVRKNHPDLDVIKRITSVEDIKAGNYTVVSYIGSDWVKTNIEAAGVFTTVDNDGMPNSVYATCVSLYDEGTVVVADNYFDKTRKNIGSGSLGSVLFITKEGKAYQLKGGIEYHTSGPVYDDMKKWNPAKHPGHAAAALKVCEVYSGAVRLA